MRSEVLCPLRPGRSCRFVVEDPLKLESHDRHALLTKDWLVYRNEATGTGASGILPVLAWLYDIIPLFLRIFLRSRDILKPGLPDDLASEIDHRSLVGLVEGDASESSFKWFSAAISGWNGEFPHPRDVSEVLRGELAHYGQTVKKPSVYIILVRDIRDEFSGRPLEDTVCLLYTSPSPRD